MYVSLFDLFKIGIGPSSSHTVGPVIASNMFVSYLKNKNLLDEVEQIDVELFGSLAYTGEGHKTYDALIVGLQSVKPNNIDNHVFKDIIKNNNLTNTLQLDGTKNITFDKKLNIKLNKKNIYDFHSNAIKYTSYISNNTKYEKIYYSIGGGFIVEDKVNLNIKEKNDYPHKFSNCNELLSICKEKNINIYDVVLENEYYIEQKENVNANIINIWETMNSIIKAGMDNKGTIDTILNVERRANSLYNNLKKQNTYDPLEVLDWVNIFAISTCEENASGHKIVTAPTNGASGIIPAVIKYYVKFISNSNDQGIINFLATASAIGGLFKMNSSISGAEVGCQGEVGVACSMAAAGLTASNGGTPEQIENAAEIAMEHNLGLTCDPIKGLVQIPCIERNSMGAIKAINASRLALSGTGKHKVSLDEVIVTMNETGKSMSSIYKETSLGGLAVNVVEC
tara:strand:+ start:543 stop:1901 length:1359 start_codon:yes stop_codon:yes gene_type:complete